MAGIRDRNTKPELVVRSYLHRAGLRFILHKKDLPGKPDLVLRRWRAVVFVNGCFWHRHSGCSLAYTPKTHAPFWLKKLTDNADRDRRNVRRLRREGWRVFTVWECQVSDRRLMALVRQIMQEPPTNDRRPS